MLIARDQQRTVLDIHVFPTAVSDRRAFDSVECLGSMISNNRRRSAVMKDSEG